MPRVASIYNTIALCYRDINKYDSAIYFFNKGYNAAVKQNDSDWLSLSKGNLAYVYYLNQEYKKALPLLLEDFNSGKKNGFTNGTANAANVLADVYVHLNDFDKARYYIDFSLRYKDTTKVFQMKRLYLILSKIEMEKKNYKTAYTFLDSSFYYNEILRKNRDATAMKRSQQKVEMERYAAGIKLLKSERKAHQLTKKGMAALLILTCIIAVLIIARIRFKKNAIIKTTMLEKKLASEEISRNQKELNSFAMVVKEKNELIEKFKTSIEKIQSQVKEEDRIDILLQLTQANILTEDDWKQFRSLFNKVYPGFFIHLKEVMPELSAADIRMLALVKLNISQKEMADMLGVGYDAIRKAKQRLRTKLNLEKEDSIEDFIKTFE